MAKLYNRAKMTVSGTPGTGTITLLAAFSNAYFAFVDAGVSNGDVVAYVIEDGTDFEIGIGTYTTAGTTLSRDTVTKSNIAGVAGTTKLTLTSSAVVYIDARATDLLSMTETQTANAVLAGPTTGAAAAPTFRALVGAEAGWTLLNVQAASASATIDFGSTYLTSTYDAYMLVISSAQPATDDVIMECRIGTGAGPTYQSASYKWAAGYNNTFGTNSADLANTSDSVIKMTHTDATHGCSNAAGETYSAVVQFNNPDAADYMTVTYRGGYVDASSVPQSFHGTGFWSAGTGPITAIRFLFSSGNIASGTFALYGLRKA